MKTSIHKPVLLNEIISQVNWQNNHRHFDGTFGGGGHAVAFLENEKVKELIAFDRDGTALNTGKQTFSGKFPSKNIHLFNANFRDISEVFVKEGLAPVHSMLLDLGYSSDQIEDHTRGFSFRVDGPLLMNLDDTPQKITAGTIVNEWSPESLEFLITEYGEEKFARRIVEEIIKYRRAKLISTTVELANIIRSAYPMKAISKSKIDPATKTFQAIRIVVNDEFGAVEDFLANFDKWLLPGGILFIISFHSGEDSIVKKHFKLLGKGDYHNLTKSPIVASNKEVFDNPRARSAKMRVIKKHE